MLANFKGKQTNALGIYMLINPWVNIYSPESSELLAAALRTSW
jgi:hypothetical protein